MSRDRRLILRGLVSRTKGAGKCLRSTSGIQ
jgi:hypothetical protein